jgi:hypothetical protein
MIGLGIMGHAMSKNLIESGFAVVGYDIARPAVTRFADIGGRVAASVGEVARQANVLLTSLPSVAAFRDVVREVKEAPRADRVLAETSTFPLDAKTRARGWVDGIVMLDCLSGSGTGAGATSSSSQRRQDRRPLPPRVRGPRAPHYLGPLQRLQMKRGEPAGCDPHRRRRGCRCAQGSWTAQMYEVVGDGAGSRAMHVRGHAAAPPIRTMPLELWRRTCRSSPTSPIGACPVPMFPRRPLFNAAVVQDTATRIRLPSGSAGEDGGADLNRADRPRREAFRRRRRKWHRAMQMARGAVGRIAS